MAIPLLDIHAMMHEPIRDELIDALVEVLDSTRYIGGPYVERFESELADYVGARRAVGVSSGTDALLVALMALDVGPGDEVITTAFTFFATVGSIVRLGATPVFADIDPVTFNIDPAKIEGQITDRTAGIIAVDLFGQSAEMDAIAGLADEHGLWVVEDAAQSIGGLHHGRMCGTMGTVGTYSFFPAKNLGALGDGGAVVTDDDALADKIAVLRNHGSKPKYHHKLVGGNFRLDALQAAALSVKLPRLEDWEETRRRAAATYTERLADDDRFVTPVEADGNRHVFNQYELRVKGGKRDAAAAALDEAEIGHAIYYPVPLHLQECFADLGGREGDLPATEQACREALAVPIMVEPSVCETVADVLKTI
ncbi:MAG: DegT/DnrJ/EryC1/StrS family aminotransferase [Planctomycetota bacterium]